MVLRIGDKVRPKYSTYEVGTIIKISDPAINPYCIMVSFDKKSPCDNNVRVFKEKHLVAV